MNTISKIYKKMKKFSILLFSAIAMVACSKDVVTDRNESAIDFDIAAQGAVKTTATTTSNISEFKVWSYTQPTPAVTDRKTVMEGIIVSKNDDGAWTYSPKKYWPNEMFLDFYAIAPKDLTTEVAAGSANIEFAATPTFDQLGQKCDCINYPDIVYATALDMNKESLGGTVTMNFRHAMSQIQFKIKNVSSEASQISYSPEALSIKGLDAQGTYTLPMAAATTEDFDIEESHGTWESSPIVGDQGEIIPHRFDITTDPVAPGQNVLITDATDFHLVIPQSKEARLNVILNIYQNDLYITTVSKEIDFPVEWKEGYRYTYTLVVDEGSDPILPDFVIEFVEVTVDDFKDWDWGNNKDGEPITDKEVNLD